VFLPRFTGQKNRQFLAFNATITDMKTLILYRPNSEHARSVEEFVRHLEQVYPESQPILTDIDSIEGGHQAELYDVMQYPAILVLAEDGSVVMSWVGDQLPLIDEVAGYLRS
jgi:hypothetical protein